MSPVRWVRYTATGAVAGIAAYVSYRHVRDVVSRFEAGDIAGLLPLSVDGLLVVATLSMVDDRRAGRETHWITRVAFWLGVVASLGANVLHAGPSAAAKIVAAWPSVALLLTVEVLAVASRGPRHLAAIEVKAQADAIPAPTAREPASPAPTARPPRHRQTTPGQSGRKPGRAAADLTAALDRLGVPQAAGRPTAQRALRAVGVAFGTAALTEALRHRKDAALTDLDTPAPALTERPDLTAAPARATALSDREPKPVPAPPARHREPEPVSA